VPAAAGETLPDDAERLFELLPVAAYVCDRDGLIVRFNRRAAALWGREPALGDPALPFSGAVRAFAANGRPLTAADCSVREALASGHGVSDSEVVIERPDGSRVRCRGTVEVMRDAAGEVSGAICCLHETGAADAALLLREMDHRVKNLFALVGSVINLSARTAATPKELAEALQARLGALARSHALTRTDAGRADEPATTLHALIRTILSPYDEAAGADGRVRIEGADCAIGGGAVTAFALLLHEFATNAAKYGALSVVEGRVTIACRVAAERLLLTWTEEGGPPVAPPETEDGFGTFLARATVEGQLAGSIVREWLPAGLVIHLDVGRDRLAPPAAGA
jgi:two-component sensor histidine kinase